jgi:hypothetical protein
MLKCVIIILSCGLCAYCRGFPLPTFISRRYTAQPHHTLCPPALLRAHLIPPLPSLLILLLYLLLSPPESTRENMQRERLGRKRETRSTTHLTQKVNFSPISLEYCVCGCIAVQLPYNFRDKNVCKNPGYMHGVLKPIV